MELQRLQPPADRRLLRAKCRWLRGHSARLVSELLRDSQHLQPFWLVSLLHALRHVRFQLEQVCSITRGSWSPPRGRAPVHTMRASGYPIVIIMPPAPVYLSPTMLILLFSSGLVAGIGYIAGLTTRFFAKRGDSDKKEKETRR